jgi:hypothetical protein
MATTYRAKTISGAQSRVRMREKQLEEADEKMSRLYDELGLLARLAATGPAFYNPMEVAAAERVRDRVLRNWFDMNADGSLIT